MSLSKKLILEHFYKYYHRGDIQNYKIGVFKCIYKTTYSSLCIELKTKLKEEAEKYPKYDIPKEEDTIYIGVVNYNNTERLGYVLPKNTGFYYFIDPINLDGGTILDTPLSHTQIVKIQTGID